MHVFEGVSTVRLTVGWTLAPTDPPSGPPRVSLELLKIESAADRWELISTVWIEMLSYIAHNCGPGFHAKHLTTGGEFISHVKVLLFILGIPFRGDPDSD